jgi:hypothetical protein
MSRGVTPLTRSSLAARSQHVTTGNHSLLSLHRIVIKFDKGHLGLAAKCSILHVAIVTWNVLVSHTRVDGRGPVQRSGSDVSVSLMILHHLQRSCKTGWNMSTCLALLTNSPPPPGGWWVLRKRIDAHVLKFPACYEPKVSLHVHRSSPRVPVLSQMDPAHTHPFCFSKISFNRTFSVEA